MKRLENSLNRFDSHQNLSPNEIDDAGVMP